MAFCSNCGAELPAGATSCPNCKAVFATVDTTDLYDHTAEFDAEDIADNKTFALCIYAFDFLGIILGALIAKESKYLKFHLHQALKIELVAVLATIAAAVLCWTIIVPVAAAIFCIILFVLKVIAFVQICKGEAKEPWLVRAFKFLG